MTHCAHLYAAGLVRMKWFILCSLATHQQRNTQYMNWSQSVLHNLQAAITWVLRMLIKFFQYVLLLFFSSKTMLELLECDGHLKACRWLKSTKLCVHCREIHVHGELWGSPPGDVFCFDVLHCRQMNGHMESLGGGGGPLDMLKDTCEALGASAWWTGFRFRWQ